MKRIAVITRDCAGVNACIRSVVRAASLYGVEVMGMFRGYRGLIDEEFTFLNRRSVSGIINLGGTILKASRCPRFRTEEGQRKAIAAIEKNNIDGVIVIGGNGSLTGAHILHSKYHIPVIGIAATIDNDVNGIDLTIGADTALNVALDALDKIRDTATSLERIFVVEVMGRECGYIGLHTALAGGCEEVLLPEKDFSIDNMCREIEEGNNRGKVSWIIIVAEGRASAGDIARIITDKTGLETRAVVLGHIQRGGRPTAIDRIMAARLGKYSLDLLLNNKSGLCVGINNNRPVNISLKEAIKPKRLEELDEYYKLIKILT